MSATDLPPDEPVAGKLGTDTSDASLGQLVGEVAADMSSLVRQEIELAKVEIKAEASKAAKGAGMFGVAGFAGYMVLLVGSFAIAYAIGGKIGFGWGTFIVTLVWALVAAVTAVLGRAQFKKFNPKPELTIETVKEDAQWARHPRS
jgi:hypothetical protein